MAMVLSSQRRGEAQARTIPAPAGAARGHCPLIPLIRRHCAQEEVTQDIRNMSDSEKQSISLKEKDGVEKRGRGRPRKHPKESSGSPVPKRPRGRPKGSKNKGPSKKKAVSSSGKKLKGKPKKEEKDQASQECSEEDEEDEDEEQ
ncbi:hypothetical protein MHYP_G00336760 [Metynnis hypsauchen]